MQKHNKDESWVAATKQKSTNTNAGEDEVTLIATVSRKPNLKGIPFVEAIERKAFPYDTRNLSGEKSTEMQSILQELKGQIIVVDGIIGAGKSTFCKILKKTLRNAGIPCIYHPEYQNPKYLSLFLSNQPKYAFAFQTLMLERRGEIYKSALKEKAAGYTVIIDRSLHGDMAFELMHYKVGNINKEEHEAYLSELSKIGVGAGVPDVMIYLDTSVQTAQKRVVVRDRLSEKSVYDISYHSRLTMVYVDLMETAEKNGILVCRVPYDIHSDNFAHFNDVEYRDACVAEMSSLFEKLIKTQIKPPLPQTTRTTDAGNSKNRKGKLDSK